MQVRRELEPIAAALVAEHATDEQRIQLVECARRMGDCAVSGDLAAFFAADKAFDEILEEACPNAFITSALGPFRRIRAGSGMRRRSPERMDRSISLHVAVIRAIQQGKAAEARKAMTSLIDYLSHK
jgi:DNA-binding GntR family transcriptional regulator